MNLEIDHKPIKDNKCRKVSNPEDVLNLEEIQNIRDAIQEHLIFIGMDRRNNINCIRILGIGSSSSINVDSKDILRTALLSASDRVILVHNHPSGSCEASREDLYITNFTKKMLKIFNIDLIDHLIVTDKTFMNIGEKENNILEKINDKAEYVENTILKEENQMLNKKIKELEKKMKKNKDKIR